MSNFYITGDTHGNFENIIDFCEKHQTSTEDVIIILGDSGINYFGDKRDIKIKKLLGTLAITVFCVRGNHEMRPSGIKTMLKSTFYSGGVFYEEKYPNIIYAEDGEVFEFPFGKTIVIGGAYSVDKYHRIARHMMWFKDEQLTEDEMINIEKTLLFTHSLKIDYVFSHTCPRRYEPIECFLSVVDQSTVDKTMEDWLDAIYEGLHIANKWYVGHFHTEKVIDNVEFMFKNIKII